MLRRLAGSDVDHDDDDHHHHGGDDLQLEFHEPLFVDEEDGARDHSNGSSRSDPKSNGGLLDGLRRRFCPQGSEEGDRDLRPGNAAHHFTFSEREKMNEYESLDYNVPQSQVYRKYLQQKTWWWYVRKDLSKWLLFCVVGAAVGIVAFLLKQTTELIAEGHFKVTGEHLTGSGLK